MMEILRKVGGFIWSVRAQLHEIQDVFSDQEHILKEMSEAIENGFQSQNNYLSGINREIASLDVRLNAVFVDVESIKKALHSLTEEHRANHRN